MDKHRNLADTNSDHTNPPADALSQTLDSGITPEAAAAAAKIEALMGGQPTPPDAPNYSFLSPPQAPDELGRLGDYRVLQLLGEGGMGFVFRGEDTTLKRFVALKVMRPEIASKPQAAERFLREGRAAAGLKSDHIITIYQVGQANGVPFMALEYLEGYPLDVWLKRQVPPIQLPAVLRIVRDTLRGLAVAHDKGLIHRDIKPANLWLEQDTSRIKVLDFGLTRSQDSSDQVTADGAVVGTPAYMAPEQASGKTVDPRADLFSVGTVMYQLLAGKNPFVRDNVIATLGAVSFETQPPINTVRADVPTDYSAFVDRMLAKDPAGRPANAKAALAELAAIEKKLHDANRTAVVQPLKSTAPVVPAPLIAPLVESADPVWDNIDATDTHVDDAPAPHHPKKPITERQPPKKKKRIAAGFVLLAVLAAGIVIIITNKDGSKTKIEVPDGSSVEVQDKGKTVAKVEPKKDQPDVVKAPDRKAAEYVLSLGGAVGVNGAGPDGRTRIHDVASLPKNDFELTHISINGPRITDQGMSVFQGTKHIVHVYLQGCPNLTSKGIAHLQENRSMDYVEVRDGEKIDDEALTVCKEWKNLTVLNVARCPQITDAGLAHLQGCKRLVFIGLNGCPRVTDAGLAHLKDCPEMTNIQLSQTSITDVGLAYFKDCKKIIIVHLAECPKITSAGFVQLANYPQLAHIELNDTKLTDNDLAALKDCKELTQISLRNTAITAKGLEQLRMASKLYLLDLNETKVGDDVFPLLSNWKELAHLYLRGTKVTDAGMPELAKATTLQHLNLQNTATAITDKGLMHLHALKKLTGLDVNVTSVTAAGLAAFQKEVPTCGIHHDGGFLAPKPVGDPDRKAAEYVLANGGEVLVNGELLRNKEALPKEPFVLHGASFNDQTKRLTQLALLRQCKHLQQLLISDLGLTDDDLANFQDCTELWSLGLLAPKVTDVGFAHLKNCKKLVEISIQPCKMTDESFAMLGNFPELAVLNIYGANVTDRGLASLKDCPQLKRLFLNNTPVTDDLFNTLNGCKKLEALVVPGTKITGRKLSTLKDCPNLKGLDLSYNPEINDEMLAELKPLVNLESLQVLATKVTLPKLEELAKSLPRCRIVYAEGKSIEPLIAADPDRKAAEYVLSVGGSVNVMLGGDVEKNNITKAADLPKEAFKLWQIGLKDVALTPEAAAVLQGTRHITVMNLERVANLTPEVLNALQQNRQLGYANLVGHPESPLNDQHLEVFRQWKQLAQTTLASGKFTADGLKHLAGCTQLTQLTINQVPTVTDAALAHFKNCNQLNHLYLINLPQLTDAGLAHFKDREQLTTLVLDQSPVTDRCFDTLIKFPKLQILSLIQTGVTDDGVARLNELKLLHSLFLGKTAITNKSTPTIGRLTNLKQLGLEETKITDAGLVALKPLQKLEYLGLNNLSITDAGLTHLHELAGLRTLFLHSCMEITAKGIDALHAKRPACHIEWRGGSVKPKAAADLDRKTAEWILSVGGQVALNDAEDFYTAKELPVEAFKLNRVHLPDAKITPEGLALLRACPQITYLNLINTNVTDEQLATFAGFTNLRQLYLGGPNLTDAGFAHFKDCKKLNVLGIAGQKERNGQQFTDKCLEPFKDCRGWLHIHLSEFALTDDGFAQLQDFSKLQTLGLVGTAVTDKGLARCQEAKELGSVDFNASPITDAGLAHLKNCQGLRVISLGNTPISDDGLKHLATLPNLAHLELGNTKVSDAGLAHLKSRWKFLIYLQLPNGVTDKMFADPKEFAQLTALDVAGAPLTAAKVQEISKALPKCRIQHTGGIIEPRAK